MTLLIVNDEIHTADTMKKEIPWDDYGIDMVYVAYDAEQGKEILSQYNIDIMLCDIEMPGENGISLLRWVRENDKEAECIFLTCHASFEYAHAAIGLGCQEYILIPAKYEVIGEKVRDVAEKIRKRRQQRTYQEIGRVAVQTRVDKESEELKAEKMPPEQTVEKICSYIMNNLSDSTLSVDSIAEKMHFHPVYANRIFKKHKGVTISQYLLDVRMRYAADMLRSETLSANEVAEKVGYQHYNNFYMMFKKTYGVSPQQYQDERKKV